MELTAKDILVKARNKIAEPENWCKSVSSRRKTATGYEVCSVDDPKACQWCATGAVASVVTLGSIRKRCDEYVKANDLLDIFSVFDSVVFYNDHKKTSHADIVAVFDRAIEAADQPEGPTMKAKDVLVKARGQIAKQENLCMSSGVIDTVFPIGDLLNNRAEYIKASRLLDDFAVSYNDIKKASHADILAVFDRAIEAAEQQEEQEQNDG